MIKPQLASLVWAISLFFLGIIPIQAASWETGFLRIFTPEGFWTFEGEPALPLSGMDQESFYKRDQCFLSLHRQYIRKAFPMGAYQYKKNDDQMAFFIKTLQGQDLTKHLLSRGIIRLKEDDLSSYHKGLYRKAQKEAQNKKRGIWQGCALSGKSQTDLRHQFFIKQRYPGFIAPVSVARVEKVLSPTRLQLHNGLHVELLGLQNPLTEQETPSHQCFAKAMKAYLHHHLQGQQIILRQDIEDFTPDRALPRYLFLPGWEKGQAETFFTLQMIRDGYGKTHFLERNAKYQEILTHAETNVYQNPKGAWVQCYPR